MPTQPEPALCAGWNEYVAKPGSKQAYRMIHHPVSVVSQCLLIASLNGLAHGDIRGVFAMMRYTNGRIYSTLLYFTLPISFIDDKDSEADVFLLSLTTHIVVSRSQLPEPLQY